MTKITQEMITERAHKIFKKYLDDTESAPVRRGWNRLTGQPVPSKRDIEAACRDNLKALNQVAESLGLDKPYNDPDEEEVNLGTLNK